ncbi:MAG: transporter substrate-binding domain-containing protein [Verrucomicrobiales bacterium]|nr:transporter substrate-binding domain-containing protein [Verrucomicrobiales bacterium]
MDRHVATRGLATLLGLVTGLLLLGAGCSDTARTQQLVVGMELSYPPFEMRDESGEAAGVSVDLARALAHRLGRELVVENLPFDGLIPALKTGRIDLVISSLTQTPERSESIDFSEPYLQTGLCLLLHRDSPVTSITNLDTAGRKVAVKKGTTGHAYAVEHLRHAQMLVLDAESAAVLEVVQGKVDAFLYDQMSTFKHWSENRETTRAALAPFQVEHWAIGVRKGNDSLRRDVNTFLALYRAEGGFDELGDRWLREAKEAFEAAGLEFLF